MIQAASSADPVRAGSGGWTAVLAGERRRRALAVAGDVVGHVTDRKRRVEAIAAGAFGSPSYGLSAGDAGLATLCGYCDACLPAGAWDVTGHRLLSSAARAAEQAGPVEPGLFAGLAGLAFAAATLSRRGVRYQRLLAALDQALAPGAVKRAAQVQAVRGGMAVSEFDLISGLAGLGAYLLTRRDQGSAEIERALHRVLRSLVALAVEVRGRPRWWTPAPLAATAAAAEEFPDGSLDCGMAHGITGPLALLSIALTEGAEVNGQAAAVRAMSGWLVERRADDRWGPNWPGAVTAGADGSGADGPGADGSGADGPGADGAPTRSAWCYGAPGVARALWLAGGALRDHELQALAVEAMQAVYRRPAAARGTDSPTFCHGVAGVLAVTLRFAHDTRLPAFTRAARELTDQLLAAYAPDRAFGFGSVEPDGHVVDRPGLLDGAAGVALVLFAAGSDVAPGWDRCFLLA